MAGKTIATKPAAGPLTPSDELLNSVTTKPPTIPAITPESAGAPDARAIPKHRGMATKKTIKPEGTSVFQCFSSFRMIQVVKVVVKVTEPRSERQLWDCSDYLIIEYQPHPRHEACSSICIQALGGSEPNRDRTYFLC